MWTGKWFFREVGGEEGDDIVFLSAKQTAKDQSDLPDESTFAVSGFTQMLDALETECLRLITETGGNTPFLT